MPERGHRAEGAENECGWVLPVEDRPDVVREVSCFTDCMVGQGGVGMAVRAWYRGTVTECPHLRMAAASHRGVHGDPAALVADDRNGARDDARDNACGQHDRAGVDGLASDLYVPPVDRPNRGRDLDVDAPTLQHACRRSRQCRVDLLEDSWAGLEQPKADLVASNARIEAQYVVGKGGELTDQFCADQSAANHDNRQTLAPLCRTRGGVGAFEALD